MRPALPAAVAALGIMAAAAQAEEPAPKQIVCTVEQEIGPAMELTFSDIDLGAGTAKLASNVGPADLDARMAGHAVHFYWVNPGGVAFLMTVALPEGKDEAPFSRIVVEPASPDFTKISARRSDGTCTIHR